MSNITERLVLAYHHVVTTRVPGPRSLSYFVPFVLIPTALMIPPEVLSQRWLICLFVPVIIASIVHAWSVMESVDVISVDIVFWAFHLIAVEDVRHSFRRVRYLDEEAESNGFGKSSIKADKARSDLDSGFSRMGPDRKEVNARTIEEPFPSALRPRLRWILELMASTRLNGWIIGSPCRDEYQRRPRSHPSRWACILGLLPHLLASMCTLSITTLFSTYDPYFSNPSMSITTPYPSTSPSYMEKPYMVTFLQIIPPPVLRPLIIGLWIYSIVTLQYNIPTPIVILTNYIFNVPTNDWSPHIIEPYFGPFTAVPDGGVRGLWGKWWHGHMRVFTSSPGIALARGLGWKTKDGTTTGGYVLQLLSAFFFSGVAHAGLVPPHPHFARYSSPNELRLRIAAFFWVQPVAILVEIAVAQLIGKRLQSLKGGLLLRSLILFWTVLWLCLTLPLLALPFAELGYWHLLPPGFPLQWVW